MMHEDRDEQRRGGAERRLPICRYIWWYLNLTNGMMPIEQWKFLHRKYILKKKNADYANYADYADYADYANYADYADYAEYKEYAESAYYETYAKYADYEEHAQYVEYVEDAEFAK